MSNAKCMKNIQTRGDNLPWYKNGLKFECQRCGSCCRGEPGVVRVDKKEIREISSYLDIKQDFLTRRFLRLVSGQLSLLEYGNGDCIMYDNGCKIYEVRPSQCKTFPFWKSNLKNKSEWEKQKRTCPGIGKGKLYTLQEIEKNIKPELNHL